MKDCPDLTKMSPQEKADFWKSADPRKLRRLGDRLMAESLPLYQGSRPREELGREFAEVRQASGWSPEEVANFLGVTENMVSAWEVDAVKTPECGPLVLQRLVELKPPPE